MDLPKKSSSAAGDDTQQQPHEPAANEIKQPAAEPPASGSVSEPVKPGEKVAIEEKPPESAANEEVISFDAAGELPGMATETNKDKAGKSETPLGRTELSSSGSKPPIAVSAMTPISNQNAPAPNPAPASSEERNGAVFPASERASLTVPAFDFGRKKKIALILGIIGGLMLIAGAGAAAYLGYYLPNKPENVVKIAIGNTFLNDDITSAKFRGNFETGDKKTKDRFDGTLEGAFSREGALQLKAEGDFAIAKAAAEIRSVDGKSLYIKIGELDGLAKLMQTTEESQTKAYASLIQSINDQWYEINQSLISQMTGQDFDLGMTFSDADKKKLENAFRKYTFIVVKETLPDEKVAGVSTRHFKIAIDKQELYEFLIALKKDKVKGFDLDQKQLDSLKTAKAPDYDFEVWIEKGNKRFRQFALSLAEGDMTIASKLTITDFNQQVTVAKPEGAKSIAELLGAILSSEVLPTGTQLTESGISL